MLLVKLQHNEQHIDGVNCCMNQTVPGNEELELVCQFLYIVVPVYITHRWCFFLFFCNTCAIVSCQLKESSLLSFKDMDLVLR